MVLVVTMVMVGVMVMVMVNDISHTLAGTCTIPAPEPQAWPPYDFFLALPQALRIMSS